MAAVRGFTPRPPVGFNASGLLFAPLAASFFIVNCSFIIVNSFFPFPYYFLIVRPPAAP
jgi:hypothetical protein